MAMMDDAGDVDWAQELNDKLEGPQAPRQEAANVQKSGNRKIVTEFHEIENSTKREKVVTEYLLTKKRVPRAVATRKQWKKFGDAASDPPGPQSATTVIADETPIQWITGREDVMVAESTGPKVQVQVSCRLCGGEHFTAQCQYQGASDAEKKRIREKFLGESSAAVEPVSMDRGGLGGGGSGAYVPPAMRAGATQSSAGMSQETFPSVRVSNLPVDVKEDDLRDLFGPFGKIKKVYLGRDKKTAEFKGFAFVTFYEHHPAQMAIDKVNAHRYFHMVLSVDWANPSKS